LAVLFPGWKDTSTFPVHIIVIVGNRPKEKMIWIHTVPNIAGVADEKTIRNFTAVPQIRKSVGSHESMINLYLTIAISIWYSGPNPAIISFATLNLSIKPLIGRGASPNSSRHLTSI
jgi:hypothetical protein